MKRKLFFSITVLLISGCQTMKKLDDGIYIRQMTSLNKTFPRVDSFLIVANGNSPTQKIMDDIIPLLSEALKKRGVTTSALFISFADQRINEAEFDNRKFSFTFWIYEQDRKMQLLEGQDHLVPLAMKLTDNRNSENVWIGTSVFNNAVRKKFYREKYAGSLVLLFRACGMIP